MSTIGTLEYINEASFAEFPFAEPMPFSNVIVDAQFLQFDNFVPTLVSISITDNIYMTFLFDLYVQTAIFPLSEQGKRSVTISNGTRYIGKIVLGDIPTFVDTYHDQTVVLNKKFLSVTVRSINSKSGVYSFGGVTGDIVLHGLNGVFFDNNPSKIVFNAIGDYVANNDPVLKTINGVGPVENKITFESCDLLAINSSNSSLVFSFLQGLKNINPSA